MGLSAPEAERLARFCDVWRELEGLRDRLSLPHLLERAIEALDLEAVHLASPDGERRAGNLRKAVALASDKLRHAAGNFYINDKPTGAVVGQQPFGGSRASGTNDKAGSMLNMTRWVSPRTIKETFSPPRDYRYAFLEPGP